MRVKYVERLNGEETEVVLPGSRRQAWDLYNDIMAIAESEPEKWRLLVRMYTATDLWMLALFLSWSRYISPWTGKPAIDCDYQWEFCRAVMARCDHVADVSPRGHAKSTWKTHTRVIQEVLKDPDVTIGFFSFEKIAATKHLQRTLEELRTNTILKTAWDDVLWADPAGESDRWSLADGANVKRTRVSLSPTLAAYSFMSGLPIGSRLAIEVFDDVEDEKAVASTEMIAKLRDRFQAASNLGGEGRRLWLSGTYHHPNALLGHLIDSGTWVERCFPAEIVGQAPPNIEALYDSLGGINMATGEPLPPAVRKVKLSGAPAYLHPIELALARIDNELGWKYEMQFLGKREGQRDFGFELEWIQWYEQQPNQIGSGKNVYIVVDPSVGLKDPYVMLAFAIMPNGQQVLVDAARRKVPPAQQDRDLVAMVHRWDRLGYVPQVRVEGYGQSTFHLSFRRALDDEGLNHVKVVKCIDNSTSIGMSSQSGKKGGLERSRPWVRLHGPFSRGEIMLPKTMLVPDENGAVYDIIRYFLDHEYCRFPANTKDDMWSAMCLLHDPSDEAGRLLAEPVYHDTESDWSDGDDYGNSGRGTWMSA